MQYDPDKHHRCSIRFKGYDYAQAGAYFVTVCAQNREGFFGAIVGGEMRMNDAGNMIARWWEELPRKFPSVESDEFIVMPNHFHGILTITDPSVGADLRVCPDPQGAHPEQGAHPSASLRCLALGEIVQWFKTMTTNEYIRGVKQNGWTPFPGKLWQRNYYEHIIRNDADLDRIREYIFNNPANWANDEENPHRR
jgi:putative transposase